MNAEVGSRASLNTQRSLSPRIPASCSDVRRPLPPPRRCSVSWRRLSTRRWDWSGTGAGPNAAKPASLRAATTLRRRERACSFVTSLRMHSCPEIVCSPAGVSTRNTRHSRPCTSIGSTHAERPSQSRSSRGAQGCLWSRGTSQAMSASGTRKGHAAGSFLKSRRKARASVFDLKRFEPGPLPITTSCAMP